MRITEDRYSRDRLRIDLAIRLIGHEARTSTIRLWTGLTDDRIRRLYRSYIADAGGATVVRHRGKPPAMLSFFTRSDVGRSKCEAAADALRNGHAVGATVVEAMHVDVRPEWRRVVEAARRSTVIFNAIDIGGQFDYACLMLARHLGIPCLTMRENTERPVTVTHGTNRLCAPGELLERVDEVLRNPAPPVPRIALWDGRTAGRVVGAIGRMFGVTGRA